MRYVLLFLLLLSFFGVSAQPPIEICNNGIDDDGDGLIDCADVFQCAGFAACSSEGANFNCADGIDNDGDGKIDCADDECNCTPVEICNNGLDDDGDGLIDCADTVGVGSNCTNFAGCERDCNNGIDDDGDGFVDYFDGDCSATPRQIDSLALVALYHATDGDNWTRSDNWLTGPLSAWYGVKLGQGRVYELRLEKNNLNGELPIEVNNLTGLYSFDFSDNDIHSIPSGLFDNSPGASGWMGGTRLTFEDLLIQSRYFAKLYEQQLIGKDTTVILKEGENYTVHLQIDSEVTTNQYVWFKDQVAFDTTATNYYALSSVTGNDNGTYTCQVTNPESVINLTLRSHPTVIQVPTERQPQTITFDSIANRTYGDSSFILRASTSASLPVRYQITKGAGSVVTLKDSVVTVVGTGEAAIAAHQDGDEDYLPATAVIRRFTINKLPQVITFVPLGSAWVGDTLTLSASSDASLPVSFSTDGPYQIKNNQLVLTTAGRVTITAYQPGNDFYAAAPSVSRIIQVRQPLYALTGQIWQQPNVPYVGKAYAVLYEADRYLGRNFRTQELPENNVYHFDSLEAGRYTFMVSLYSSQYVPTYWGGHYLLSEAQTIQLRQDTTLNLTLLPTPVSPTRAWSSIRGRLVGPSNADNGRSTDENDALAEVSVYLRDAQTGELLARTVTDETGAFAFTELPEGTYTLAIDHQGLPTQENTVVVGNHQEATVVATVTDQIVITVEEKVITALNEAGSLNLTKVSPNPTTGALTIRTSTEWINATIRLQNTLGHTVHQHLVQSPTTFVDMTQQRPGIYLLTIRKGNAVETHKVVRW